MIDVALFPIPNSVCFPGMPCPLHVFEPRYRQMVRYCIENEMLMGVCHTERLLHESSKDQTREEALNSNQSTYKPCAVFSAGPVQLLEELEDGRMVISVETSIRLTLLEEKQTLPFSIWACEEVLDRNPDPQSEPAMVQCKEKILKRLITMTHGHAGLQARLKSDHWQSMTVQNFSFAISGMLGMDPDLAQQLLETTDTQHRLETVLGLLNTPA